MKTKMPATDWYHCIDINCTHESTNVECNQSTTQNGNVADANWVDLKLVELVHKQSKHVYFLSV